MELSKKTLVEYEGELYCFQCLLDALESTGNSLNLSDLSTASGKCCLCGMETVKRQVLIEVRDGVAEVLRCDEGVVVRILDRLDPVDPMTYEGPISP